MPLFRLRARRSRGICVGQSGRRPAIAASLLLVASVLASNVSPSAISSSHVFRVSGLRTFLVATAVAQDAPLTSPSPVRLKSGAYIPEASLSALDAIDATQPRHILVQFKESYRALRKAELSAHGLRLLRYVPDHTWIAALEPGASSDPILRERLSWVGTLAAEDKVPPRFLSGDFGTWAFQPDGRIELRVRLHDDIEGPAREVARQRLTAMGAEILAPLPIFPGYTVRVADSRILELADLDEVLWISEGLPVPEVENDGLRARIGANEAQAAPYNLTGAGVNAGIADGGTIFPHTDFASRLTQVETDASVNAHGTHVTGTLVGDGTLSESQGGAPFAWRGVATAAQIFAWDFFYDVVSEMKVAAGDFAVDVHNDSWGYGVGGGNCGIYGDYDFIAPDLDSLVLGAGGRPMTVVFSAGNERDDGDCPLVEGGYGCINPPKPAKNILVVGATNSDNDTMTEFSSWGPVDDGRLRPDVTAPGCEDAGEGFIRSTLPNQLYGGNGWCGTSMATPAVSGSVALLLEAFRTRHGGPDPAPSLMKAMLCATATDLGNPGPDYIFGHGRINTRAAAKAILGDTQFQFQISQDEVVEFPFHVPGGLISIPRLTVLIAWDDPDAVPNAQPALVNDIDLLLIDPIGQEVRPWVLNPALPSLPAVRGVDSLNNVENVGIDSPIAGTWVARVIGTNVPEGPQLVSLVGFDLDAPATPDSFAVANPTSTSLNLTWIDDRPVDYTGTLIVRIDDGFEWDGPSHGDFFLEGQVVEPGVKVIYQRIEDHSTIPWVDPDLLPGTTYRYAAYTFDDARTYSPAAIGEGTTQGTSSAESSPEQLAFGIGAPRPNPASPRDGSVVLSFGLSQTGSAGLRLFDPSGRLIRTLVDAPLPAGSHVISWDGRDSAGRIVPSGIYFCELRSGGQRASRHISWIR